MKQEPAQVGGLREVRAVPIAAVIRIRPLRRVSRYGSSGTIRCLRRFQNIPALSMQTGAFEVLKWPVQVFDSAEFCQ